MGRVRIGTCSWADKTMAEAWYPSSARTPEGRLRYYASRFDTVEADSPYYAIPDPSVTAKWAERTPEGFLFHVKAYGMMTGHAVLERSLPPAARSIPHEVERERVRRPSTRMLDSVFEEFAEAVRPLRTAGRLGGVLMQYPPWFAAKDEESARENLAAIEGAGERLAGMRMLVEFRHPSWLTPERVEGTMRALERIGATYVSVDAPRLPGSTVPPLVRATSDWAYVRLHGRNADTWGKRTGSAADRFDYLYSEEELREWESPVRRLAQDADEVFVMFNNCKRDYAPRNAAEMQAILADLSLPPEGAGRLF